MVEKRGRPPIKRTPESYLRDIESLRRLKISLIQFNSDDETAQDAIRDIDSLVGRLWVLSAVS
jgi:hypothetical protein